MTIRELIMELEKYGNDDAIVVIPVYECSTWHHEPVVSVSFDEDNNCVIDYEG